jgi:hypothetical protein
VDEYMTGWQPRSKNRVSTDSTRTELSAIRHITVREAIKQRETTDPGAAK